MSRTYKVIFFGLLLLSFFLLPNATFSAVPLEVLSPPEKIVASLPEIDLIFKVNTARDAEINIKVNGKLLAGDKSQTGNFHYTLGLKPGLNTIVISNYEEGGIRYTKELQVFYRTRDQAAENIQPFRVFYPHGISRKIHCSDCHDSRASGPDKFTMNRRIDIVCYKCHEDFTKKAYLHGPLGAGECNVCHNPHGSDRPALLNDEESTLCFICHEKKLSEVHFRKMKERTGGASDRNCVACHDPHASSKLFQLK